MALVTVIEAAEKAGVMVKAVCYALAEGSMTRRKQHGRVLVDEEELKDYLPRAYGERPSRRQVRHSDVVSAQIEPVKAN